MTPDQLILLAKARRRRAEAQGASAPSDVPPAGDMGQRQQSPPDAQPHRDTLAEKIAYAPITRAAVGVGETLIGGPFQLGANLGSAAARKIGEILPKSAKQYYDTGGDQLDEKVAEKQRDWEELKRSTMEPGEWDVAGGLGAMAAGALAMPGSVPAGFWGRVGYGAGTGALMGSMAPQQESGLEHNAQGAVIGGALGGAIPAGLEGLNKLGKVLYHAGIEPHFAAGREAIKGRAYLDAGGERIDDIATALRNYVPKVEGSEAPAGEAAASAGSAEFSAMQHSAEGVLPSEYVARGKARDAARLRAVRTVGKDKQALANAVRARGDQTRPLYAESDAQMIEDNPDLRETLSKVPGAITSRAKRLARTRGEEFSIGETRPAVEEPTGLLDASGKPYTRTTEATTETFPGRSLSYLQKSIGAHIKDPTKGISSHERQALTSLSDEVGSHLGEPYAAAEDLYKGLSEPVNQMRIGQFLEGKLTNSLDEDAPQRAASYATALRDAPATVRTKLGGPRLEKLTEALTPEQVKAVESVRDDLASMAEQARLARAGSRSGKNVMQAFTNSIDATGHSGQLPNLLSRPAMAFNFIMRRLKGQMDEKLAREIAQEMLDPKATGQAIERAITRRDDVARTAAALRARTTQGSALAGAAAARASAGE